MEKNNNEIIITEEESKICLLDNKTFSTSREMICYVKKTYNLTFEQYILKAYYNNIRPMCLKTGKPLTFKGHKLGPWFKNYTKNAFPRKNHTKETKNKIKESCEKHNLEKFGVKNVFSTDWCKEKIKNTNLERYGVKNPMQSKEISSKIDFTKTEEAWEKTKKTNLKKYGKETVWGSEHFKKIFKENFLKNHGVESPMHLKHVRDMVSNSNRKYMLDRFDPSTINKTNTKPELEFKEFLTKNNIEFEQQKRFNNIGSVDFYLNKYDMWVEIDGEFWHKEIKESLNFDHLKNSLSDKLKDDNIPDLIRIRETDVNKLKCVDDLKLFNYRQQLDITHDQILMEASYFKYCIIKRGQITLSKQIQKILNFIRICQRDFPYPTTKESLSKIISSISEYDVNRVMNDSNFSNECWALGNSYLKANFKSYWKSKFKDNESPYEAWFDDKIMKDVIGYRIGCNDTGEVYDLTLKNILKGMSARRITVSFFKPILAAAIYVHYLGDNVSPTVLDPCCGFGGRLLGFKSKYPNGKYIGCEPNIETYNELMELVKEAGWDNVHIYNCKFEDYQGTKDVDLTFTSIPYYDVEEYSNNVYYRTFELWRDTFIKSIESCKNCYINTSLSIGERLGWLTIDKYLLNHRTHFDKGSGHKKEGIFKVS